MKYEDLQKGDILLTKHDANLIGRVIADYTCGEWTHAMIYAGTWRGHHMVLESHYGGVKYTTLEAYIRKGFDIAVMRSNLSEKELSDVLKAAEQDLGKGYDYKGLFGYLVSDAFWSVLGARKEYHSAEKLFCSELVKHHFEHAGGVDLSGKPSSNTSPMDLKRSDSLIFLGIME